MLASLTTFSRFDDGSTEQTEISAHARQGRSPQEAGLSRAPARRDRGSAWGVARVRYLRQSADNSRIRSLHGFSDHARSRRLRAITRLLLLLLLDAEPRFRQRHGEFLCRTGGPGGAGLQCATGL